LSPEADRDLLDRFSPVLRYDSQGSFFADSARMMTDHVATDGRRSNSLRRQSGEVVAAAKPKGGQSQLSIDFLASQRYANGVSAEKDDYLDAVGKDYVLAAREMHGNPQYANRCYGHAVHDDAGTLFLQYWFFYYYNDKAFLGFGLHEGDWEMVQLRLATDGNPDVVTFAQHNHAERCPWGEIATVGGRLVVYVARGSQASYPRAGRHRAPIVPDHADGRGAEITPAVEELDDRSPAWVGWGGRWGSSRARNIAESDSPRGPKQHGQWKDPAAFQADAIEARPLEGLVMGQPELLGTPAPRIKAHRLGDRAIVSYRFPRPRRGQAPATQIVLSVDSPDDDLPPATYSFPVEGLTGEVEHPLELGDRRYVARASGFTHEGVGSDTVETPVRS
jgi:hypothetical protein